MKLLSGTGFAFMVSYLAKLVLLKLYAPADFGVFAFVVAVVGILAPLVSLRYEDALMLPEEDRRSAHLLLLTLGLLAVACVLLSVGSFFGEEIAAVFGDPAVVGWVWTIPILLFLNRSAKITELWMSRKNRFGTISAGQVVQSSTMTGIRIGWGLVRPSPAGLIFGFALAFAASLSFYTRRLVRSLREALGSGFDRNLLREVAGRYRKFPLFTMPASLLGNTVSQVPVLLLLFFFNSEVLGIYSQAVAVLSIPLSQVGAAVSQVFFVRAVEASRAAELDQLSERVHRRLVAMAFFPACLVMIAGGDLFEFLFGATWRASGEYLIYLAPWIMLSTVASPLTRIFDVLERQKLELLTTALMLVVVTGALWAGGSTGSVERTLLYLGIAGSAVRAGQIVLLQRLAGVSVGRMVRPYLIYAAYSAIPLGIVALVAARGSLPLTFAAAAAAGLLYMAVVVKRDGLLERRDI